MRFFKAFPSSPNLDYFLLSYSELQFALESNEPLVPKHDWFARAAGELLMRTRWQVASHRTTSLQVSFPSGVNGHLSS